MRPRTGGWCPIYGTLKGSGTLAGPYRFIGGNNCWVVEGVAGTRELARVNFCDATLDTFAGLKSIKVTFNAKPTRKWYYLTGAIEGLTVENMPHPALNVAVENDDDYEALFTLTVKNNRLALKNGKPKCMMLIVR